MSVSRASVSLRQLPILLLILQVFAAGQHIPTDERGDFKFRRKTDIDGNKVRTTIFNYGLTGRTGAVPGEIPYEWPINTGRHYIALTALFVGAEVFPEDSIPRPMVTVPLGRTDKDGGSMEFNPVPEYLNPTSKRITKSDEPDTWPDYWPDKSSDEGDPGWRGSWNGYFGKDQFNADQEIYFKISDDNNFLVGTTYYPDTTDLDRRGAGILAAVRVMEWSQVLVEDVVFVLYEIKNDGTKDLNKVSFALWLADLVGGDGDSADDAPGFDLVNDIAWSMDKDGIGNAAFGSDPVGVAASSYLETPGNSVDRIDNDGDGEDSDKKITLGLLEGETRLDGKDDNSNGLIDETEAHVPFADQPGVSYANGMDDTPMGAMPAANAVPAEAGSPTVTADMIFAASLDVVDGHHWRRWPPSPEIDPFQAGIIHLIMVEDEDEGKAFADGIDNDEDEEYPVGLGADVGGPRITWAIIDTASTDLYRRYRVPGTSIILYDVDSSDFDLRYADGIDNDGDGAVDEGIDEGIDEMVDESRDDFIDNDGDWNPFQDDVGMDGNGNSLDPGQNDQRPTSGALSNFPGEPNIDKTDVSESDQMGLTSVAYDEAGSIPTGNDRSLWDQYMRPGLFNVPDIANISGDFDLFVTSAYFPILAGETKRISMAIALGQDTTDAIRNKDVAQQTYDEDYQFAKQPYPPNVHAIAGDNQVTLIWDAIAEQSFDSYMYGIGSEGYDFEGYKIYKATDPGFLDALNITDAQGNLTFSTPLAQWDLIDGITGYHVNDVNGVHYDLGSDKGLLHSYIDRNVKNGQTYYYAVVSYDFGGDAGNKIPPTECNKRLVINTVTGEIRKGPNVAIVTPNAPAAGFVEADVDTIRQTAGTTSSYITYKIVDHFAIRDNHSYHITFEDTLKKARQVGLPDSLTTKHYFLVDVTDSLYPDTLIAKSEDLTPGKEQPLIDGFRLTFYKESFVWVNQSRSGWSSAFAPIDSMWQFNFGVYSDVARQEIRVPADYRVEIGASAMDTSTFFVRDLGKYLGKRELLAKPTNFTVKKRLDVTGDDAADWQKIPFAFDEAVGDSGILDADIRDNDLIIFLDDTTGGGSSPSWTFQLNFPKNEDTSRYIYQPGSGDTANIILYKPFLSTDEFMFTTISSHVNKAAAKTGLKNITVVPNPYRAAVAWEPRNPFTTGRGPRAIHFRHLPAQCTIRIFNVAGELVRVLEHNDPINDGTEIWDLLTRDQLSVAYGVYIYHVDAPGIGEHTGKFAIIK